MMDAGTARAQKRAGQLTTAGAALTAMIAFGQPAGAETPQGQGRAPIVYSGVQAADAAVPTVIVPPVIAPTVIVPAGRFTNSAAPNQIVFAAPIAQAAPTVLPRRDAGPAGAIDLRPGSISKASFGSAPAAAPNALRTSLSPVKPAAAPASTAGLAQPYAGAPYQVDGKWYVPTYEPNYDEVGIASWYGPTFHGKAAATGETFDEMAMTAAHPTLPIPSIVRVTNLENGKTALVRLNDRGPFVDDRIIDLSKHAGEVLGLHEKGTAKVRVQYVGPAPAAANVTPRDLSAPQSLVPGRPAAPPLKLAAADQPLSTQVMPALYDGPATVPSAALENRVMETREAVARPITLKSAAPDAHATDAQHGFLLQAGSFTDTAHAEALRAKLAAYGPGSLVPAEVNGKQYYRVMVGPWASHAEAVQVQARMAEAGAKTIVVDHSAN